MWSDFATMAGLRFTALSGISAMPNVTTAVLELSSGSLTLSRPGTSDASLRAWNAADELLLKEAFAHLDVVPDARALVVDDQYGALTLGLSAWCPDVVADSAQLRAALALNAELNPGSSAPEHVYSWVQPNWVQPPPGQYDLILLRIPREADYLAWLLRWINGVLAPEGVLLAAGMIKHLPDRSVDVFNAAVDVRNVSRAVKKARLITCRRGDATLNDWQGVWKGYELDGSGVQVVAMPAVFAREKLDQGTRLMLPHLQTALQACGPGARVLDLACGNGVLGLRALMAKPELDITFSDVSSQAVLSARHNTAIAFPGTRARFVHADGVASDLEPFDLILLNPPFHEGGVVGDHIALRLFEQASRSLSARGRMLIVGNRHLGYHKSLRRFFPHIRQLDANPRFVVFEAWHR